MRALSVKQPFAEQIARGDKKIEYRTWKVAPFGDLLIVASKTFHPGQDPKKRERESLVYGTAVCVVDFHKVTGTEDDYRWHVRNPRRVEPVDVKGYAALYTVEDSRIRYVGAAETTAAEAPSRNGSKRLALVVDGDPRRRRAYEKVLERAHLEVVAFDDGAEAWKAARSRRPAILVAHFALTSLSGLEIYMRAAKAKELSETQTYVVGEKKMLIGVDAGSVLSSAAELSERLEGLLAPGGIT